MRRAQTTLKCTFINLIIIMIQKNLTKPLLPFAGCCYEEFGKAFFEWFSYCGPFPLTSYKGSED